MIYEEGCCVSHVDFIRYLRCTYIQLVGTYRCKSVSAGILRLGLPYLSHTFPHYCLLTVDCRASWLKRMRRHRQNFVTGFCAIPHLDYPCLLLEPIRGLCMIKVMDSHIKVMSGRRLYQIPLRGVINYTFSEATMVDWHRTSFIVACKDATL